MPIYRVELHRTEYLSDSIDVEADDEESAQDKAWDLSGNWKRVDADESIYSVTEIANAPNAPCHDHS
jgi:hypothetical protein